MKKQFKAVLIPLAFGIVFSQYGYAGSSVSVKPTDGNTRDNKVIVLPTVNDHYVIERSSNGERMVDLTNPEHEKFVYDRLETAGVTAEKFPQLYKEYALMKEQQLIAKSFPESNSTLATTETELDGIIKNSLFFVDNNFGIAEDNGKAYVYVKARSSVYGGSKSTYADILLEDQNGNPIGPIGSDMNYGEGTETNIISIVSLDNLRANFPDLTEIVASSYVKVNYNDIDGTSVPSDSKIKYTKFPFSWAVIDSLYPEAESASLMATTDEPILSPAPEYIPVHPVDSTGATAGTPDGVVKVCLNRSHTDCDYPYDQALPNASTLVQIPFSGTMKVNHKINKIWDTTAELPPQLDEATNIYVQEGVYGGVSLPRYATMDNGTDMHFSDYVQILEVDETNMVTTLTWDIPRNEGVFGNALLFSNRDDVLWNITLAVSGFPFFEEGRGSVEENFQISLSAEDNPRFGSYYAPVLKKLKFGYSCLAKDTLITMADGSEKSIDQISKGDLVIGALASSVETAQPMTVVDVSVGIEVIPMIRVTTRDGHSVLMTETHPVVTGNKGIVWAKELVAGDRLLTDDGSVMIRSVATQDYNDGVYNLALAPLATSELATGAEYGMFADGLFVGDLSMQDKYNYKDKDDTEETVEEALQRIPVEYHTDYLNSLTL